MVGGIVKDVLDCHHRGEVWVNCIDRCYRAGCDGGDACTHKRDECAIYVERNEDSLQIRAGDKLWWQGGSAFWTAVGSDGECSGRIEVDIQRRGYSGVSHPAQAMIESAYQG